MEDKIYELELECIKQEIKLGKLMIKNKKRYIKTWDKRCEGINEELVKIHNLFPEFKKLFEKLKYDNSYIEAVKNELAQIKKLILKQEKSIREVKR